MGYSQADKAETHDRIVDVGSRRFRELGLEGISVAELMKEAGLTVGGFYKHFVSRDDLVTEALAAACVEMDDSELTNQPTLEKGIRTYLSAKHRDTPASGCPLALLVNDTARSSDDVREVYTKRLEASLAQLEAQLADHTDGNRRKKAILIYSSYIGAIGLSRAVSDPKLSNEILRAATDELIAVFASSAAPTDLK